jgi:2-polyprenyl-3-methyl-5-hydroxy-6-metoxy-1,4-benzoquinol methylase
MDLSERRRHTPLRHPWETARVAAIQSIVTELGMQHPSVLDVGCGDGYVVRRLHQALLFRHVVAQDPHLTDALISELCQPDIDYVRELNGSEYRADVILLLDVLEHAQSPATLLHELAAKRLAPGGRMVITAPAFEQLFAGHDRALKHFRRYSRKDLEREVRSAGLQILKSGYLFSSLLLPRALDVLVQRVVARKPRAASHGIGNWQSSAAFTKLAHLLLTWDNRMCLAARAHGVLVPGLTIWMTCKTSS